ncbi:hypothetical protein V1525DRAFT_385725 [Lipomyces kononenkoae]|uniref:Uncharacterized protein n=1 Tax=Lipomyces kononenkoae TaxID=34357 RepID=A0ACC3T9T7_LIPKO
MAVNKPGALGTVIAIIARTSELPCRFVRQEPYFILSVGSGSDVFIYKGKNEWVRDDEYMDLGEWDEEVRFDIYDEPEFQVMKFGVFVRHADQVVRIGETEIDLAKVQEQAEHDSWWRLTNDGEYAGKVFIELTFYPMRKRRQRSPNQTRSLSSVQRPPTQPQQSIELQQPMQPQQIQQPYSPTHPFLPKAKPLSMPALPQLPNSARRWSESVLQGPRLSHTPHSSPPLQHHQPIRTATPVMPPNEPNLQIVGAYPQSPVSPTSVDDNSHPRRSRAHDVNYYTLLRDQQRHSTASSLSLPEDKQSFVCETLDDPSAKSPSHHTELADAFAGMSVASQSVRRVRRKPVGSPAAVTTATPASAPTFFSAHDIPLPPSLQRQVPQPRTEYLPSTAHAPELGTPEGYAAVLDSDSVFREQIERQAEEEARARSKKERELARRVLSPGSPALPPKIPLNVSREEFLAFQARSRIV